MRAGLAAAPGTVVGPFRLDGWLGGGHDTDVWRAEGDGIVVALKLLRDSSDVFARARLAREAAALRRVDHPNVVRLFDAGEEDGEAFVALALHEAGTLALALDEGRLEPQVAAAVLAPIADALAAAHAAGVVHRDVKPGNLLLTADGPMLVDFGASAIDGVTLDGWVSGAEVRVATPRYAPPEPEPGPAYDVWSLGVVLAEAAGLGEHSAASPVSELVAACCADEASERPSAREVAAQLAVIAGGTPPLVVAAPLFLERPQPAAEPSVAPVRHGRELELARLVDEFDAASASAELRATLVSAAPGMGKSWLLDAAAARVASQGALVLRAACSEAVADVRVIGAWLRRIGTPDQIAALVGPHHAAVLLHATGLVRGPSTLADNAAIAESLAALLGECAHPVAVIDDMHHAAPDLIDLLARLTFRSGIDGVLWLGARPGAIDPDDLDVQTISLAPLADDVIIDLAGAEAAELAGGNPMLARELALARGNGATIGTDVRALIAARLERLTIALPDGLALAAACGDVFWPEALGTTRALALLCREGVVRVRMGSAISASTEAEWLHPLLREVAYERLQPAARRDAHVGVAHALDAARGDVEMVAHHAVSGYEQGRTDTAPFVAGVAARAGRVALDRFALSSADRWVSALEVVGVDPAPGTTDTLRAELLLRRGDFAASAELADRWVDDAGEMATRALAVSAEAHLATGDLERAQSAGAKVLERLADSAWRDQVVSVYAAALAQTDRSGEAAELCQVASHHARARGERASAARLQAQAASSAAFAAFREGSDFVPQIATAIAALDELDEVGDRAAFVAAAFDLAELVSVVDPARALELLERAAGYARDRTDETAFAHIAHFASTVASELGDGGATQSWARAAEGAPADEALALRVRAFRCALDLAEGAAGRAAFDELCELSRSELAHVTVLQHRVAVAQWFGWLPDLRSAVEDLGAVPVLSTMANLGLAALTGPPWTAPVFAADLTDTLANELALLELLRGDTARAEQLLVGRFAYLSRTGSVYQSYNACYSGALTAALGPDAAGGRVDWLVAQILDPPFPRWWAVHRAICAVLLAERGHPAGARLARAGLRLLDESQSDAVVSNWLVPRLEQSVTARGRTRPR